MPTSIHTVMSEPKHQCVARIKYTNFLSAVSVVALTTNGNISSYMVGRKIFTH